MPLKALFLSAMLFAAISLSAGQSISGVELVNLQGWYAVVYPWEFLPEQSPVHPIPELFTPEQHQTPSQMAYQCRLLDQYGSAADILSLSSHPDSSDYNHWLGTYFTNCSRPFFILWEHLFSGFSLQGGFIDVNNAYNRQVFMDNLDFMFNNVIRRFGNRYVTIDGRAIIYLWASGAMVGDLAGLFDEARKKYPVAFFGSGEDFGNIERIQAFDGFMEYSLYGFSNSGNYKAMIVNYRGHVQYQRKVLNAIYKKTGKKIYLIPTFQAAYDDTLVIPPRGNRPLYAKSRVEVIEHARLVNLDMNRWNVFDNYGPLVVWSELPEGGAVIPSLPRVENECRPDQIQTGNTLAELSCGYVGYGTDRLNIVARYFGRR